MADTILDQFIARLSNLNPFNIYAIHPDGSVRPWYDVTGAIVKDLVVDEVALGQQVQTIAAQVMHWGRLAAQAKRVWEIEERGYRQWRDRQILELIEPPADPERAKGWKKPTEIVIEATYRTDPEYAAWNQKIERAEEAFNACLAVQDGFRAKRDMLMRYVTKHRDDSQPHLSV
jgi:hypothetical protein